MSKSQEINGYPTLQRSVCQTASCGLPTLGQQQGRGSSTRRARSGAARCRLCPGTSTRRSSASPPLPPARLHAGPHRPCRIAPGHTAAAPPAQREAGSGDVHVGARRRPEPGSSAAVLEEVLGFPPCPSVLTERATRPSKVPRPREAPRSARGREEQPALPRGGSRSRASRCRSRPRPGERRPGLTRGTTALGAGRAVPPHHRDGCAGGPRRCRAEVGSGRSRPGAGDGVVRRSGRRAWNREKLWKGVNQRAPPREHKSEPEHSRR